MSADAFTLCFAALLLLQVALKYWLALRQVRHVARHAGSVPPAFAAVVELASHRRAAAYTVARERFALVETAVGAALLLGLTLLGGLQSLAGLLAGWLGHGFAFQLALVATVAGLLSLADIPIEAWRLFRIEQAFGFNRTTPRLFLLDQARSAALGVAIGLPLLAAMLALMRGAGTAWWLYGWLLWCGFSLALMLAYPVWIAPLFNRFTPLADLALRERIDALLARTGSAVGGIFTMDGSRRSSHGNAYFTGLGAARRIVFFDTLLERLAPAEVEAVLAHELGHHRLRHVLQRLVWTLASSLALMALLGWLARNAWFYAGLGVEPLLDGGNEGLALVLFLLALPVFGFPLAPLSGLLSRRQEYAADAYAARHSSAPALVAALVKLYQDNASTLTPDSLHSRFYDSHPPAALRVARLRSLADAAPA